MRLSVGAVEVHTGNSQYFDNTQMHIGPEHILASGSLPPGFPPVEIKGKLYWDGGIVSNTPLWYVLDDSPRMSALILQVDLFSARGDLPQNLDQVMERAKDIQYSSKTRFNTNRMKDLEEMRDALGRVLAKLPPALARMPSRAPRHGMQAGRHLARPPHQPPLFAFVVVEGLRILARDGDGPVAQRARPPCASRSRIRNGATP